MGATIMVLKKMKRKGRVIDGRSHSPRPVTKSWLPKVVKRLRWEQIEEEKGGAIREDVGKT